MLPKRSFKPAKCKTALNLAKSRIKLMKNKKDVQLKQLKREVAHLLESGQDQTARIRVEHVVREEKMIDAYEMIEIYCELVVARLPIIESQKNCPLDLNEAIASLIFAAPRCGDIVELQDVRKHFTAKYGKEFVNAAVELRPGCGVSRNLVEKLSVKAPDGQKKVKILTAIAEEHNIKWEPNWFKDEDPMPSVDITEVAVAHTVENSRIQMQPLNFEIADDLEEKHAHDRAKPGTSSQSHADTNNNLVPPSTSRPACRPPESFSEMVSSQPSRTTENSSVTGWQNWNMEFKDATAAAQAAAESAEMASLAARAAAQLSSRSNVMGGSSSGPGHPFVHGQSEENQMNRNSIGSPYNQRSPRMENQVHVNKHGRLTGEGDSTSLNDNSTQFGVQYETGNQDFIEREYRRQTRKSGSGPTSEAEPNMFKPSYFQDYEIDSSENPFYEETAGRKNQSSSFHSQSSAFGDDYGVFANSKYDDYKHDSGDSYFGSFSIKTADQDDWHVRSAYTYGKEDMAFKDHIVGMESCDDIFVGMDHRTGGKDDEKGVDTHAGVYFDESGSDDDDSYALKPAVEHNVSSLAEPASKGFSHNQDKPYYERDLSESFKKSSIYSKLTEPLAVTFDDSDEDSLGSEKQLRKGKSDPQVPSYDYQKHDANPHLDFMRSSYVEEGTEDSFTSSKHVENIQNQYHGSVSKLKSGFDDYDALSSPNNSTSSTTNFKSHSDYGVFDEEKPQKSMQSKISESRYPVSEFEYEAQPRPEGGMELNLGSLPGGRRNRAHWHIPRGASSPLESTEAAPSDTFGSTNKASNHDFQISSNQTNNKQAPMKMNRIHMHYDLPDDETEVVIAQKDSNSAKGSYSSTINENVRKVSPKDPTGYFDPDESSSDEDAPKPVMSKAFVGAGLSRRTKGSAPRSAASSVTSASTPKTRRSSISYDTEISSSIADQSNWNGKESDDDQNLNSSMSEKPTIPKSPKVPVASNSNEKAPSSENSTKKPSHVHPKLPDFETFAATLQSLRKNH
ncbi:IST1-like protein [Bienertia sinuspersici]